MNDERAKGDTMENTEYKSKSRRSKRFKMVENILLVILFITSAYFIDKQIFTSAVLVDVFRGVALISVFAMAQSIVLASGGIDLSLPKNGLLSASIVYYLLEKEVMGVTLAITMAILLSGFIGLINGLFVAKLKVKPVIVTLATALLASGVSGSISNNVILFDTADDVAFLKTALYNVPISLAVAVFIMFLCWAIFKYTVIGRQVFALGGSERSAQLSGLNVNRIKLLSYTGAGFIAGVGGIMVLANSTVAARFYAAGPEIAVLFAVIIGGVSLFDGERIFFNATIGACVLAFINRLIYGVHAYNYMRSLLIGLLLLLFIALRKNMFKKERVKDK